MTPEPSISTLLVELHETVMAKGADTVITLLRNARQTHISENENMRFVVATVCQQIGVEIQQLLHEHSATDSTKYAKAFIVYYLREDFHIAWKAIKDLLGHKDQSYLWRLLKLIKVLKPHLSPDQLFYSHKQAIDMLIREYKSNKTTYHG